MGCDAGALFTLVLLIIFAVLFISIAVYTLHKFINEKNETRSTLNKVFEIVFLVSSVTVATLLVILAFKPCNIYSEYAFLNVKVFCGGLFLIQTFMTLVLFYNKLLRIFDGTTDAITKCTRGVYTAMFILLGTIQFTWLVLTILSVGGILGREVPGRFALIMFSLFLTLVLHISMVIVFTSKLVKIIQNVVRRNPDFSTTGSMSTSSVTGDQNEEDDRVIGAISKLTVLTTVSLIATFANYIWQNVENAQENAGFTMAGWWISVIYVWMFDLMTNFLGIMLCYHAFKTYYLRLCGCMDICCRKTVSKACVKTVKVSNLESSKTPVRSMSDDV